MKRSEKQVTMNQITDSRDKRDQKADEHTNTNLHFQSISLKKKKMQIISRDFPTNVIETGKAGQTKEISISWFVLGLNIYMEYVCGFILHIKNTLRV